MNAPLPTFDAPVLQTERAQRALKLSELLHNRHTKTRSEDDQPYFTHPFAIATLLAWAGYVDDRTIAVAAGHDLLDKTPTTPATLTQLLAWHNGVDKHWAEDVVTGIIGLSDESSFTEAETAYAATLDPHERRFWKNNRQIDVFFTLPDYAKPARFGDIIHNAATMSNLSDELRTETHRKGIILFDKKNWDGNLPQAILATTFFMNINLDPNDNNDDLIGPWGVRAPMPFLTAIPTLVSRAFNRFQEKGYPDFRELEVQAPVREQTDFMPSRPTDDEILAIMHGAPANRLIT
jgi:hypothetical protein